MFIFPLSTNFKPFRGSSADVDVLSWRIIIKYSIFGQLTQTGTMLNCYKKVKQFGKVSYPEWVPFELLPFDA